MVALFVQDKKESRKSAQIVLLSSTSLGGLYLYGDYFLNSTGGQKASMTIYLLYFTHKVSHLDEPDKERRR